MRKHKAFVLILLTMLVAMSGTLAWLYWFDNGPKKAPARARQVMLMDDGINFSMLEQTTLEYQNNVKGDQKHGCSKSN